MQAADELLKLDGRLGVRIPEAAKLLGISTRTLYRLIGAGRTPPTCRLGSVVVFKAADLAEWARLGFPDRQTFEAQMKRQDRGC